MTVYVCFNVIETEYYESEIERIFYNEEKAKQWVKENNYPFTHWGSTKKIDSAYYIEMEVEE